jgi:hypothetical protein
MKDDLTKSPASSPPPQDSGGDPPADDSRTNGANLADSDLPRRARLLVRNRTRKGKRRLLTLEHLDGRTVAAKTARNLITSMTDSLGGAESLNVGERELVTHAAMLGAMLSDYEARWTAGHRINFRHYLSALNTQRQELTTLGLGLERRQKDVNARSSKPKSPYMAALEAEQIEDNKRNELRRLEFEEKQQRTAASAARAASAGAVEKL